MITNTSPIFGHIEERFKRFLARVVLDSHQNSNNNEEVLAHVPNTGPMKTCWMPQWPVVLSKSDNIKRKLAYTLEATHNGKCWIGVNTHRANSLVAWAIQEKLFPQFHAYTSSRREWPSPTGNSRFDFLLEGEGLKPRIVEVKSTTWMLNPEEGIVSFPDTKTQRGAKHLEEMMELVHGGQFDCTMVYAIQRNDAQFFSIEQNADPHYSALLKKAMDSGLIEILTPKFEILPGEVKFQGFIPLLKD